MNTALHTPLALHLPLSFSVAAPDTLDTLEAVLAIARRGGLRLAAMRLSPQAGSDEVFMDLQAAEADLLALFLARLRNHACVAGIVVHRDGRAWTPP